MAEPKEKYPEAKEGKHYIKVPNPKHPTRLDWKCLCRECPNRGTFSRKEFINKHWIHDHPQGSQVQSTRPDKPGRKPVDSRESRLSSIQEKAKLIKAQHGFFPWRWQATKSSKLHQVKNQLVKELLTRHFNYLKQGPPPAPGPIPHLLLAFEALDLPYLEKWKHLKYTQFRLWFTDHLHQVLTKPEHQLFRDHMGTKLMALQEMVRTSEGGKKGRKVLTHLKQKLEALTTVVSACREGVWGNQVGHLLEKAISYMEKAENHYWHIGFHANAVKEVHEVLQMDFLDWKFSQRGRERKREVGKQGLSHRKRRLADLGIVEDNDAAILLGRFKDAEQDDSDDDEKYRPHVPPFNVHNEVKKYVRDNLLRRENVLSDWANIFPEPEKEDSCVHVKRLVVQTSKNLGSLQWELGFQTFQKSLHNGGGGGRAMLKTSEPDHAPGALTMVGECATTLLDLGAGAVGTSRARRTKKSTKCVTLPDLGAGETAKGRVNVEIGQNKGKSADAHCTTKGPKKRSLPKILSEASTRYKRPKLKEPDKSSQSTKEQGPESREDLRQETQELDSLNEPLPGPSTLGSGEDLMQETEELDSLDESLPAPSTLGSREDLMQETQVLNSLNEPLPASSTSGSGEDLRQETQELVSLNEPLPASSTLGSNEDHGQKTQEAHTQDELLPVSSTASTYYSLAGQNWNRFSQWFNAAFLGQGD
ncbi:unnamed protein product [Calypogeia fissa]